MVRIEHILKRLMLVVLLSCFAATAMAGDRDHDSDNDSDSRSDSRSRGSSRKAEILNVFINKEDQQFYVIGRNFPRWQRPTVYLGEMGPLEVESFDSNTVIVNFPDGCGIPDCIMPGDYLLVLASDHGKARIAEFDVTIGSAGEPGADGEGQVFLATQT